MESNVLITNPVAKMVLEQSKDNKRRFVESVRLLGSLDGNTIGSPIKRKRSVWAYTHENATIYYKKHKDGFTVFHALFFDPEQ